MKRKVQGQNQNNMILSHTSPMHDASSEVDINTMWWIYQHCIFSSHTHSSIVSFSSDFFFDEIHLEKLPSTSPHYEDGTHYKPDSYNWSLHKVSWRASVKWDLNPGWHCVTHPTLSIGLQLTYILIKVI